MAAPPERVIMEVGKRLSKPRLNKDTLVKLLKQAESALSDLSQSSSLKAAIGFLSDALVQDYLLQHRDKDVRLLVAVCLSEVIRVLAPSPPFGDELFKDVFKLTIGIFAELADTRSPYFTRRLKILETIAALRCCLLMLDIGCEDLVLEMFNVFFSVAKEDNPQSMFQSMVSIMSLILEENVSQPLLDLILWNLLRDEKAGAFRLAISVTQTCAEKLEPSIYVFLTSCISDKNASGDELKRLYHEIILRIFEYAPHILIDVIPKLAQELLTDQVDVRLKAVHLVGKLLSLSKLHLGQEYRLVFIEFLKRFSDKSAEVRIAAVDCAKACYVVKTFGNEAHEILIALGGRLLDFDDKVRAQTVITVCDMAKTNLASFPSKLVLQAVERLRDKKLPVRKMAMRKLLELYQVYCVACSKGFVMLNDHYEQIPCKILVLCFDNDCTDFRPQNMELVLANDLFPASISVEEKMKHWTAFFSLFMVPQIKALNSILAQKRRLQMEMIQYLALREKEKENSSETNPMILASFSKMSHSFLDCSKANECFQKLHQMKDNSIFRTLSELLNEPTSSAQAIRDAFLRRIGNKHPNYDFFKVLSSKCSNSVFTAEHVCAVLQDVLSREIGETKHVQSAINLLLIILSMSPSLLRGSEKHFLKLFAEKTPLLNEKLLQILSKVGCHVSIKLSDIYPFLEQLCCEGTRVESKNAISAIASLIDSADVQTFSHLCKKLVRALRNDRCTPTILQSLGCISQYCLPAFELYEEQINRFIYEKIFYSKEVDSSYEQASTLRDFVCSPSCKLKIYGLKTLVNSFLPNKGGHARCQMKEFLDMLLNIIQGNGIDGITTSDIDKAHLRLAAAKSSFRLATRWDLHISPKFFHFIVMTARDSSPFVRKSILCKLQTFFMEHAIPSRYACAFALACSDSLGDLRTESMRYLSEFFKEYSKETWIHPSTSSQGTDAGRMTNYPEYIIVFLIHVLAHDKGFPSGSCQDVNVYAEFCSPLIATLLALIAAHNAGSSKSSVRPVCNILSYAHGIFRAIGKAEDAVDPQFTPKLHILSSIGLFMIKALKNQQKSSADTPRLVLLPSSFYNVSHGTKLKEACNYAEFIDESFAKRLLDTVHSTLGELIKPESNGGKPQKEASAATSSKSCKDLLLQRQGDDCLSNPNDKKNDSAYQEDLHSIAQKANSKAKQRKIVSTGKSILIDHPHESSVGCQSAIVNPENPHHNDSKEQESYKGKEQLSSSCDSASTNPLLPDSQVLAEDGKHNGCLSLLSSRSRDSESNKMGDSNSETDNNSKELGGMGEALVGHRVRLWSPAEKRFSSGTVDSYDSENHSYKIMYDDDNVELLCLEKEKWEFIGLKPSLDKDLCHFHPKDCSFSRKGRDSMLPDDKKPGNTKQSNSLPVWSVSSSSSLEDVDVLVDETSQQLALLERRDSTSSRQIPSCTDAPKGRSKRLVPSLPHKKSSELPAIDETAVARRTRSRRT